MGTDHREPVAEQHDDPGVHAGQLLREHRVFGQRDLRGAVGVVVPVHPEEVERVGGIRLHRGQGLSNGQGDQAGLGQLGEGREQDVALLELLDRAIVDLTVHDVIFHSRCRHVQPPCSLFVPSMTHEIHPWRALRTKMVRR